MEKRLTIAICGYIFKVAISGCYVKDGESMILSLIIVGVIGIGLGLYGLYLSKKLRISEEKYKEIRNDAMKMEWKIYHLLKENNN